MLCLVEQFDRFVGNHGALKVQNLNRFQPFQFRKTCVSDRVTSMINDVTIPSRRIDAFPFSRSTPAKNPEPEWLLKPRQPRVSISQKLIGLEDQTSEQQQRHESQQETESAKDPSDHQQRKCHQADQTEWNCDIGKQAEHSQRYAFGHDVGEPEHHSGGSHRHFVQRHVGFVKTWPNPATFFANTFCVQISAAFDAAFPIQFWCPSNRCRCR